jgi:hypothetical protein
MSVSKLESRMFIGKTQRQWGSTIPTWYLTTPAWVLTITRTGSDHYFWILTSRVTRKTWSSTDDSVHEAERAASESTGRETRVKGQRIGACAICFHPAFDVKTTYAAGRGRTVFVCPDHKAVCRPHLKDPCEECDSR